MRINMIIALTAVGGLLLTGTANAYPIEDTALTENALYDSGKLATAKRAAPRVKKHQSVLGSKVRDGIDRLPERLLGNAPHGR
jgi:uncharacterized protein